MSDCFRRWRANLGLDLAELHTSGLDSAGSTSSRYFRRGGLAPFAGESADQRIPVTILSADATAGQISRLMDAGARDYLTKPLDVRKLH